MREIPQLEKKPGTVLVLSGGATKAFYFHLGVLKVLRPETDVTSIVGSSAGAIIGSFIASGASVDTLLTSLDQQQVYVPRFDKWLKTLTSTMLFRPKYGDIARQSLVTGSASLRFLLSLPTLYNRDLIAEGLDRLIDSQSQVRGFFDAVALEDMFCSLLPSQDFSETEIDLYVTATDLDNQKRAVFNSRYEFEDRTNAFMTDVPIHRAVRASSSVPGMFEPVKIRGRYYIDGEVKRTLSADIGVSLGDKIIISHTYQPLVMTDGSSVNDMGWLNILRQSVITILYERIQLWREAYGELHPERDIVWIHPEPDDKAFFLAPEFSFRPEVQNQMIACGEAAARKALDRVQL